MNTLASSTYDIVIIGAGLGGLLCAAILSKEGKRVCVLEKNKQLGGCLQTFAFEKKVFDSCVHYIGGLGKGHTLNRIMEWLDVMPDLRLQELDGNGFDKVYFGKEGIGYPLALQDRFKEELLRFFPHAAEQLDNYLKAIEHVAQHFPLYHLNDGDANEKEAVIHDALNNRLKEIITDEKLRAVLCGNALLYAGSDDITPFYLHALVLQSYLHSAHKLLPGSSALSKRLHQKILEQGGVVLREHLVQKIIVEDGIAKGVVTDKGLSIFGQEFISNLHPAMLDQLTDSSRISRAFRRRMKEVPQSPSCILLNMVLKPGKVMHKNFNVYWHHDYKHPLLASNSNLSTVPQQFALFSSEDPKNKGFSETISVMYYAAFKECSPWAHTYNTTAHPQERGQGYEQWKAGEITKMLLLLYDIFPEYKDNVVTVNMASPLTFRDYKGSQDGSLYGIQKDVHRIAETTVAVRTKIPNLFLTGENINMHGVLGVSITALATCGEIVGLGHLLKQIKEEQPQ